MTMDAFFLGLNVGGGESEDDEEVQLSSRDSDSERSSSLSTDDNNTSLPSVVEFHLESPTVGTRNVDIDTINSIVGNITDPVIRSALESIVTDAGQACQICYRCSPDREWSSIDLLCDGLLFAGFDPKRLQKNNTARKTEWFKAFYGVEHTTAAPYLADLRKDNPDVNAKDCLMTMNWLTCYDTYPVLSARWKRSVEYIGPRVIEYGLLMAKLGRKKIVFALKDDVKIGRSVDGVTFMTREMRLDPSSKWFDWKTHSCGLVGPIFLVTIYVHNIHNLLTNTASLLFTEIRILPSYPRAPSLLAQWTRRTIEARYYSLSWRRSR